MSAKDFNGRLLAPVIALPRRPLSNKASTDSCSIRFSLRTIISGAFKSKSRLRRLLRLITLRYKSLRSEVANLPPSSGTNGRKSGGNTGNTVKIIHSGLFFDSWNASSTRNLLLIFLNLVLEFVLAKSVRNSSICAAKSISCKIR
ncbi:MAG: hypothetical protein ACD_21C00290G0005 [uncultured bacterium]|nr:MAG: hypothetical protein ACD_21C00290G0005 [uncultured bacterium]